MLKAKREEVKSISRLLFLQNFKILLISIHEAEKLSLLREIKRQNLTPLREKDFAFFKF